MPAENVERKLSAILSADVKGYSRLMGEDEVGTLRMLTAYREVTDALIQQHRGRIVGTAGDGLLAELASAVDAVQCAVEIQQALKTRNADLPPERRMEFRIIITEDEACAYAIMIAVFDHTQGRLGDKEFLEVQLRAIGK